LLIHRIGKAVAEKAGLSWIEKTWRKNGGFLESVRESRRLGLRRQNYCGCTYSRKGDETA
jgi:predicted adenine nucleotide alpha hydrolase (AANH) superfamily ATPase